MSSMSDPAGRAVEITPSNSETIVPPLRALYIGGAGDVKVDMADTGAAITFVGVPAGTILPVRVTRVYSTDTDATSIVGLA